MDIIIHKYTSGILALPLSTLAKNAKIQLSLGRRDQVIQDTKWISCEFEENAQDIRVYPPAYGPKCSVPDVDPLQDPVTFNVYTPAELEARADEMLNDIINQDNPELRLVILVGIIYVNAEPMTPSSRRYTGTCIGASGVRETFGRKYAAML